MTREEYDVDGEWVWRIAERFVAEHPDQEVWEAVGRGATTDVEFERWRWGVVAPFARQVVDRCGGDVSRVYGVAYTVMFELKQVEDAGPPAEQPSEVQVWAVALSVVKAALYMAHGRESMLAFMSGSVMIDSLHPREE